MHLVWTAFKAMAASKNLAIQEVKTEDWGYELAAYDGPQVYHCVVDEDDNAGADKVDYENNYQSTSNQAIIPYQLPFAAKVLPNGKKLYERKHGIAGSLTAVGGSSTTLFAIPYPACKITAVDVIGACAGDQVDFSILDTTAGTLTTIPSYKLNQFGFGVFIAEGFYKEESRYDADLFMGLQLEIVFYNNGTEACTPNFNATLHEVKD